MIQGDIDLTKNLDFYRDKKKSKLNSIIPWRKKNIISSISSFQYNPNYTTYSTYGTATNNYESIATYTDNTVSITRPIINYNIDSNIMNIIYHNIPLDSETRSLRLYTQYSIDFSTYSTISWTQGSSWVSYNIGTTTCNTIDSVSLTYEKPSCFGPRKSKKDKSLKIAYLGNCTLGDEKYKKDKTVRRSLFKSKKDRNKYNYKWFEDLDPTDKSFLFYYNKEADKKESYHEQYKYKRVRAPWLLELPDRIYQDYIDDLHEDTMNDYSQYLTNMGWLRIGEN